jgi:hypothetical protein
MLKNTGRIRKWGSMEHRDKGKVIILWWLRESSLVN